MGSQQIPPPLSSRQSASVNASAAVNGHGDLLSTDVVGPNFVPQSASAASAPKKGKGKKAADPNETSKLLAAKISQLESDQAGEKDQAAEIDRDVKKAIREMTNLLSSIELPLSKVDVLLEKYKELHRSMLIVERDHSKSRRRGDLLQREKDAAKSDLSKTVVMKEKLEKLARDLQKDNKKMKDDRKIWEEEDKKFRAELNEKLDYQGTTLLEMAIQKENPQSEKVNVEMDELFRQKFKSFIDQFELQQIHFQSLLRTKELEVQYNLARFEQQKKKAAHEAEKADKLSEQVATFSDTESELRSQLNIYVEKFKQVEDTLNNSNDLFLTFRKEMEEMSKKTKRLEKENLNLTRKHDLTNRNILEMAEERTRANKDMEALRKKNAKLETLCRGMQAQGRGQANVGEVEADDEGTESDYEYDEEDDEEGSEDVEYDEDTEEDAVHATSGPPPTFGPVPPPPPPASQSGSNSKVNGSGEGAKLKHTVTM